MASTTTTPESKSSMTESDRLKKAALTYADIGWHVFPCRPQSKIPMVRWREASTTDADTIEAWWELEPEANIGVDCGKSGLLVVDLDDHDAFEAAPHPPLLVPTLTARTGKGHHYYYLQPNIPLANTAGHVPGVDTRGVGGMVLAPPSLHPNGDRYEWTHKIPPVPLPEEWNARLRFPGWHERQGLPDPLARPLHLIS